MNTRQSSPIPFLSHFVWLAASALVILTGCRKSTEDDLTKPLPEIITIPESTADLRALIATELAAGKKRIVIPEGRYRVQAVRGSHLSFSDLKDVEIIAENVELVCTSTVSAVLFQDCTNVTLRGLVVDYDPLPFTQGKIIAMATDKKWIEFEVAKGYPENEMREHFQIYNPATGKLRRGDARWDHEVKSLGNHRFRLSKAERYRFNPAEDTEEIGDIVVARTRFGKAGSPHAIDLRGCKGMRFEDITLYASPSFGFLERNCDGSTYLRCIVDRRAPEHDPIKRALPRMRSLNADAYHSKDALKGPAILSCKARFQGDDCVNINGRYHYVLGSSGRELRVAIIDEMATIKEGDPIEFMPYSGPRPPDAKVVKKRIDPKPMTEKEKAFIRELRIDERMRSELLGDEAKLYTLTLNREVALPDGSAICCPLRLGHGFAVKDCDFGDNRSRGILIKASKGEVSGNRITNSRMASVLISAEYWWMEAGMSSDLMIKNNIIKGCLESPIQIRAIDATREILPVGALRNISILNNRIENSAWPLIHVTSTSDLSIKDNILPKAPPEHPDLSKDKQSEPILLENCDISEPKR